MLLGSRQLRVGRTGGKLTKRVVEALRPDATDVNRTDQFVWDRDLKGFGVRVSPKGLKSFIVQYRTATGRHRRTVIGRFGLVTVEQARVEAHERLVAVSKGLDPAEESASARKK